MICALVNVIEPRIPGHAPDCSCGACTLWNATLAWTSHQGSGIVPSSFTCVMNGGWMSQNAAFRGTVGDATGENPVRGLMNPVPAAFTSGCPKITPQVLRARR